MRYFIEPAAQQRIDKILNEGSVPVPLLLAVPELAREEKMRQALANGLYTMRLGSRVKCAQILDYIGDSRGLDHLVFNSMQYHPLLKYDQRNEKGWGFSAVRFADKLTENQVQFLIDEMITTPPDYSPPFPTLAYAKTSNIVPAMLKFLDKEQHLQRLAAYVLAYHGNDQGVSILKNWAETSPFPHMPLMALSQLPGDEWAEFFQPFANLDHPVYANNDPHHGSMSRSYVFPYVSIRLALQQMSGLDEKADFLIAEYTKSFETLEVEVNEKLREKRECQISPAVNVLSLVSNKGFSTNSDFLHDILADLADKPLQAHLAKIQRKCIQLLLDRADLNFDNPLEMNLIHLYCAVSGNTSLGGVQFPGFEKHKPWEQNFIKVYYDTDDYLNASTDWILNPLRHRTSFFISKLREYKE